jgi:hypothetical protein
LREKDVISFDSGRNAGGRLGLCCHFLGPASFLDANSIKNGSIVIS